MHDTAWWSTWQGALMIALMILIAGLLVWLIARSRTTTGTGGGAPTPAPAGRTDDAVAQARMRYARGELDRATYAQIVQDLSGAAPGAMAGVGAASTDEPGGSVPPAAPTSESA